MMSKDWSNFEYREAQPGDKRLRPRLGNIPVDVQRELVALLLRNGQPMHIDEIYAAWGKLRLRSVRDSAAADLLHIVAATTKRERRAERNRNVEAKRPAI